MGKDFSPEYFYDSFRAARINENAREEWREYREWLTKMITEGIEPGASVAIFGAGRCEDIDITELAEKAGSISLVDFDTAATEEAVRRAMTGTDKETAGRIAPENADFVGISRNSYIEFTDIMYSGIGELVRITKNASRENPDAKGTEDGFGAAAAILRDRLIACVRKAYTKRSGYIPNPEQEKYDYSIVMGVHSQLNNSFTGIWNYAVEASKDISRELYDFCNKLCDELEKVQREYTDGIIREFNDAVMKMTRKGLFVGYETESTAAPGSPVEGAIQGAQDMERRLKEGRLALKECYLADWPLDMSRNLMYKMMIGKFEMRKRTL